MSHAEAARGKRAPFLPDTPARAALLGAGVALVLEAVHLFATLAFVDVPNAGWLLERGNYRIGVVVSLLTGFMAGSLLYGHSAEERDLALRRRELGWSEEQLAAVVDPQRPRLRGRLAWALALAPVGTLLLTASDTSRPFLFTDEPWTPSIAWALFANVLLFAWIGAAAHHTWAWRRVERALDAHPAPLDLFDTAPARRIASVGLRRSFFWLAGSSLGSLVLLDLDFSWMTAVVVAATLAIGTALFLAPFVKLARRIEHAKDAELARVRARLRSARDALLGSSGAQAGELPAYLGGEPPARLGGELPARLVGDLPALLAYEKRIQDVRAFAVETSQVVRFATLILLAVGSWLGGALVDLLVERSLR